TVHSAVVISCLLANKLFGKCSRRSRSSGSERRSSLTAQQSTNDEMCPEARRGSLAKPNQTGSHFRSHGLQLIIADGETPELTELDAIAPHFSLGAVGGVTAVDPIEGYASRGTG